MRSSLFVAFCLFLAGAAQAQDLNVITGVEVKDDGGSVLVTVKGSKPPNFTTFSMADPARFVIDLSEAKFQGVPEDMRVDDGVIRVVKNLAYGSGASSIARVMLAFTGDVEPPDVQTVGTSLLVRVNKPGGAAVAAARPGAVTGGPAAPASAGADGNAAAAAAAARVEADEAARKEALAREQREFEAKEQARLASEASAKEREAQAKVEADARTREAEKVAAEQAAAEEAARTAADARRAEIKAKIAADEGQPQKPREVAPVAAAPVPKVTPAEQAAKAEVEREARAQATADAAAKREIEAELAAQQASEARARAAAAPPAPAPAPVPAATPAAAPAPTPAPERVAASAPAKAPTPAPSTSASPAPIASLSSAPARPAKLKAVGFAQLPAVSRVFVKTSATPHFTITDVGDDVVRLEVENTRASRRNDTRPLDTSFFPSAVAMITPSRQGTSYVVDIKLKKRVPYQQKVEGDLLAIDFERSPLDAASGRAAAPGVAAPTGAPAAGQATEGALENQQGMVVAPDDKAEEAEPAGETEPATEPAPKQ